MPPFALSVLDQSPISEGMTGADALRNTIDLAQLADDLGYERYWVAEHHGTPMLASAWLTLRARIAERGLVEARGHTSRRSSFPTPRTSPSSRPTTPARRPPTALSKPRITPTVASQQISQRSKV